MMSQSKVIQDTARLAAPNGAASRVISVIYSGEQNFPMMGGDWLFSLEALALVGRAMYGETWDGTEFSVFHWQQSPVEQHKWELAQQRRNVEARQHFPRSIASSDYSRHETAEEFEEKKKADLLRISSSEENLPALVSVKQGQWEMNRAAFDRLIRASKWLGDKCRSADIKTGYGSVEHLPIINGHAHSWNCVSDIQHWVKDGSLRVYMTTAQKMHRCNAYVSRSDLAREMRTLAHSPSIVSATDLARLPPYLKFAVDMALAQDWLVDGKYDSAPVREAMISEKWPDAFPNIELSNATKVAIAKVLGIPDATAINRSVAASSKSDKK